MYIFRNDSNFDSFSSRAYRLAKGAISFGKTSEEVFMSYCDGTFDESGKETIKATGGEQLIFRVGTDNLIPSRLDIQNSKYIKLTQGTSVAELGYSKIYLKCLMARFYYAYKLGFKPTFDKNVFDILKALQKKEETFWTSLEVPLTILWLMDEKTYEKTYANIYEYINDNDNLSKTIKIGDKYDTGSVVFNTASQFMDGAFVGSTVTAGILIIPGVILAPFTGGASLGMVGVAAVGVGVATGLVGVAADAAKEVYNKAVTPTIRGE